MLPQSPNCKCPKKHSSKSKKFYSVIPGILIALIPKCPFCILTYTSAITICSTKNISGHAPHWTSWLSIGFAFLTLIITLYNYKGQRTLIAAGLIFLGSGLIVYSELFTGLLQTYYWGCGILIFGVWVNGSFMYFLRLIFRDLKIQDSKFKILHDTNS
jgi:hypothetical protein